MASRIKGITVEIGGDVTKLDKALRDVNNSIKDTQGQLKDVERLLKLDPGNTELLAQKQQLLAEAIEDTRKKLETLKEAERQAQEQLQSGDITQEQYMGLQREIVATEQKLKSLEKQAAQSNVVLQQISVVGEKFQKVGDSISGVGEKLLPVTTAVGGIATAAVTTAADFDSAMSKVAAVSGAAGDDLDALREKAREMGSKTKFSASEAAEAMNYMAMAGWKTKDMLSGIEGIMNLAAASGEDLATTSDIVTDALTAFGLSASDSGRFADVLAAASNNANTNVSMLGESFKYVAPVAGALGYSVEDTSIALGLMANSGIKATNAGTALRTLLTNMSKPTKDMSDAMDVLGISLTDDEGNMYSLMEVMEQLRDGFGGGSMSAEDFSARLVELDEQLSDGTVTQEEYDASLEDLMASMYGVEAAQKAELAAMLAGKQGMSGLLAIVNASEEDFNKLAAAINNSNGTAEEMAAVMQDNLNGQMTILKSQLDELFISFGEMLMPMIRSGVSVVQAFVDKLNSMDESTRRTIVTVAAIAAAVGPVLIVLGNVITAVGKILSAVSAVGPVLAGAKAAASGLFAVLAANPVGLVVVAIAALIAIFATLWNNCEDFRNFWIGLWDGIVSIAKSAADMFANIGKSIVDGIKNGISNAWKDLTSWFSGLFDSLIGSVKSLLGIHSPSTVFANIGSNMALGLGGGWDDEYKAIKDKIKDGLDFGTADIGVTADTSYNIQRNTQDSHQAGFGRTGDTYVTINSPVAVDAVTAAREWKQTTQRMALAYV